MMQQIKNYLKNLNINFIEHKHHPVYTFEEAKEHFAEIPGVHSKSLFLKNDKANRFFLVVLPGEKRLNIKSLEERFGEKLKFGNEAELEKILKIKPGSVSPFALINDKSHQVELLIEKEVWEAEVVSFHPNINTETLQLSREDFHKFTESLKNKLIIFQHGL